MYTLYFSQGACSLATQVILRELNLPVVLVSKARLADYQQVNPLGAVPALGVDNKILTEGAAIILYLLNKHPNELLPLAGDARQQAIEDLLFANATVHPAYSKLFFIGSALPDGEAKTQALNAAAEQINKLWNRVETKLANQPYLGGYRPSAADILLAVYESWGQYFPVSIELGPRSQAMIDRIRALPSYQASVAAEQQAA
ncbi:glutathione S-transferase family protein [Bowmanella yangjiangensis]|uniref:Glutathione S-transferase family protein n=1 Tax=Bowmanella yangjiangensis TaxID=2811230 RepID=A0ABS3CU66_9ALTE|nr:glutathione S-transferase family protein [Bowmanella yangjiangensis]MBN7820064.1 glutathione S-transferase family protein [Bowmanella yangjiangensis]